MACEASEMLKLWDVCLVKAVVVASPPEEAGSGPVPWDEEALQLGQLYVRSACRGQTSGRGINWEQVHLD